MSRPGLGAALRQWLSHPLTRGLDLDDPRTTELRRAIIRRNAFLTHVYRDWYTAAAAALPPGAGPVVEIGAGAGFFAEAVPGAVATDLLPCSGLQAVLNAQALPFPAASLRALVMFNVFHHVPDPRRFLREAARCLRPGGRVVLNEPWVSSWSRLIYTRLHHEPFDPAAPVWEAPAGGPLSGANGALPWIMFQRDRAAFAREFPQFSLRLRPWMPWRYLVSGGVSLRPLMPGWLHGPWRLAESAVQPWMPAWAMFCLISLTRQPD